MLEHQGSKQFDLNAKEKYGQTAFMLACYGEHLDVIKLLMDYSESKRIDLNATDEDGYTALMNSCGGRWRQPNFYPKKKVVELLLTHSNSKGIDFNAILEWENMSAFMMACSAYRGNEDIVKLFIDHSDSQNIDLNFKSTSTAGVVVERTAFSYACSSGNKSVVQLLLNHPSKIHVDYYDRLRRMNEMRKDSWM